MSQWTNGYHWEQINKLIKETIVCCVKFKRFLMWILHVWNLQWINVYSNQTKGFCFISGIEKESGFYPEWGWLWTVYQNITLIRCIQGCFKKDTLKINETSTPACNSRVCTNNIFKSKYLPNIFLSRDLVIRFFDDFWSFLSSGAEFTL